MALETMKNTVFKSHVCPLRRRRVLSQEMLFKEAFLACQPSFVGMLVDYFFSS